MAKHPTPKRKLAKSAGRRRYSSFQYKTRKKLDNKVSLTKCTNCSEPRLTHHACPNCGFYRGRQVLDLSSKLKKKIVTKVSA
ncbi:MAG: 50S ribosomal protein L32 [Candidatus Gracilibacteria bacterium]|nr:50S ribosomal protein L32 [Candidatus Gracilibacteria bacterium]